MSSFIYFYSKFTEEFLLLGGAGIFTLLSAYCYHWVIKRRRLGAARSQVPAGVVQAYLNQLINEAQFVRTQLFGLLNSDAGAAKMPNPFLNPNFEAGSAPAGENSAAFQATAPIGGGSSNFSGSVPTDLLERLKALEGQLAAKESLVVNINVEKTKLLEEVENLKQNQKALQNSSAMSAGQDELLKKIKNLEERLEEYSLFEDDLANLKRLQQENTTLKKRLEDGAAAGPAIAASGPAVNTSTSIAAGPATAPALTVVPGGPSEPVVDTLIAASPALTVDEPKKSTEPAKKATLDQNAIDSLLDGVSPIAPAAKSADAAEPSVEPVAAKKDEFENLVDSVESSLNKPAAPGLSAAPAAEIPPPVKAETVAAAPTPAASGTPVSEKSDEELLKEFENLLNS